MLQEHNVIFDRTEKFYEMLEAILSVKPVDTVKKDIMPVMRSLILNYASSAMELSVEDLNAFLEELENKEKKIERRKSNGK